MDSRASITTPNEVSKHSPVGVNFSAELTSDFIINQEETIFNTCMGWDFYKSLLDDLIDYDTLNVCDFELGENYDVNDYVYFNGSTYQAIQRTTGEELPTNKNYWTLAPKFSNPDYEFLWVRYLRRVLCFSVLDSSILFEAIKATDKGLVRRKDQNNDPAEMKEIDTFKQGVSVSIKDSVYNMDLFLRRNKDKYPLYKPFQDEGICSDKEQCSNDYWNFGFNVGGSEYAERPDLKDL